MTIQNYQQLILEGTRDLPNETLQEIVDFVLFLRKRTFDREGFDREMESVILHAELSDLDRTEGSHLEMEVDGYEQRFPRE